MKRQQRQQRQQRQHEKLIFLLRRKHRKIYKLDTGVVHKAKLKTYSSQLCMNTLKQPSASIVRQIFELLRDHCTGDDDGRKLFVRKCAETLSNTSLASNLPETESWAKSWDKPLYANQSAEVGTRVAERIRHGSTSFDYPSVLPSEVSLLKAFVIPLKN